MARMVVASYPRCTNMRRAAARIFWRVWTRSRCRRSRLGTDFVITQLYHITTLCNVSRAGTGSHDDLGGDVIPERARRARSTLLPGGGVPDGARGTRSPRLGTGHSHPLCRGEGHEASLCRRWPGTCPSPAAHPEDSARHVPESHPRARAALSGLCAGLPGARLLRHPEGGVLIRAVRDGGGAVSGSTRH